MTDTSDEDRLLAAWDVTREEIEAVVGTPDQEGSQAWAEQQAKREQERLVEWYTAGMEEIASGLGLTFKTEPILRRCQEET